MRTLSLLAISAMITIGSMANAQEVEWKKVDEVLGRSAAVSGDVHRYGFPRTDLTVTLDGVTIKPTLALGGWLAFKPAHGGAMVMGDVVLLETEVNPVITMPDPPLATPEAGFKYLFDGSDAQFADWQMAGGGSFSRFGRTIIAQQDGRGIGLFFYTPQQFENFVLRLDFLPPHPRGNGNDNSGVFIRFRDPRLPDPAPDPVDPANNAAFVAVHTGYEVQIDEEARGDTRFNEPDGSFFSRTGAIYKIKSLGTGPGQQNYQNNQNLAAGQWHRYEIEVNNQDYIVRLNGQEATRFRRAVSETVRGNPPSVDAHSGFIGLQTHTGAVAFANVRIKT